MSEHDETRDVATKRGAVEAARQEERRTPIQPLPDTEAAPRPSAAIVDVPAEVGATLTAAVQDALAALEKLGVPARDADEFIHDCVFAAWWDWDYEGPQDA